MHIRRSFLEWGVFLVCLGAIPLAVQLGLVDRSVAGTLLRLWPLILVGIGIGLVLRFTPLAALGGVLAAGIFGVLLGAVLVGGIQGGIGGGCAGGPSTATPRVQSGSFGETAGLNAEISCGDFNVTRTSGVGWSVSVASDGTPVISSTADALTVRSREGSFVWPFDPTSRDQWQVALPAEAPLTANVTTNAAQARLVLGNGPVDSVSATFNASDALVDLADATSVRSDAQLNATLNASSVDLILPAASVSGGITLNAASLNVCVQPGTGVRINYRETLSSNNFSAAGLVQNGELWQSPDYGTAATNIALRVTANVSSITLNPAGGCQ